MQKHKNKDKNYLYKKLSKLLLNYIYRFLVLIQIIPA